MGAAPLALASLAPREQFRAEPERSFHAVLTVAIGAAADDVATVLKIVREMVARGADYLDNLYASLQAPAVWHLICGFGPLTRAELARALGVTRRTASQAAMVLEKADLATLRPEDRALAPKSLDGLLAASRGWKEVWGKPPLST